MPKATGECSRLDVTRRGRAIASGAVIALAAGCSDTTAPITATTTPPLVEAPVPASLVNVAGSLDDMTEWWMPSVQDATARGNLQQIIAVLRGHLSAGKVVLCQQDITDARVALSKLSDVEQSETGPIGVALDVVASTLEEISK